MANQLAHLRRAAALSGRDDELEDAERLGHLSAPGHPRERGARAREAPAR
jgi:hypothetical protein